MAALELLVLPLVGGFVPGVDGAFVEALRAVWHDEVHVVVDGVAEALAARAGAEGIVEAEQAGLRRLELLEAGLAAEGFGEAQTPGLGRRLFEDHFAAFAVADLGGIDDALVQVFTDDEAIHQGKQRLGEVDVEQAFRRGELEDAAVLEEAVEAFGAKFKEAVTKVAGFDAGLGDGLQQRLFEGRFLLGRCGFFEALIGKDGFGLHDRKQGVPTRAQGLAQQGHGDLVDRVALDGLFTRGAPSGAGAGIQEPQKVVDLGRSGDGGARIARGVLLFDGHRRRDAVDLVDVGLLHAFEKLARVGRHRFDVPPLPFGIDGIEDERTLAGA